MSSHGLDCATGGWMIARLDINFGFGVVRELFFLVGDLDLERT